MSDFNSLERLNQKTTALRQELGKVVVGQNTVVEQLLIALLSKGHALLTGVPGLAKTLMVSSLARVLKLSFKRIQFTPDLMPSDITDGPGRTKFVVKNTWADGEVRTPTVLYTNTPDFNLEGLKKQLNLGTQISKAAARAPRHHSKRRYYD